jgi:serine protease Do
MGNDRRTTVGALWLPALLAAALIVSADVRGLADSADQTIDAGMALVPKAIDAAVQRVLPSVVRIETFGGVAGAAPSAGGGGGHPGMSGLSRPGEGPSTGLIIAPDGLIATSTYNFLRRPEVITVVLHDGSTHVAKLLGRDDTRKITLLKIDGVAGLPVPRFAEPASLAVGQWAVAVGMGYGSADPAISAGIVSAKARVSRRAVQTDAKISPANYGGPLIGLDGQVLGICVPLSPMGQSVDAGVEWYDSGIGFAIPLAGGAAWLDQLAAGKTIQPGRMGVIVGPDQSGGGGVAVLRVAENSPAAAAGIIAGDRIIAVNQDPIGDLMDLKSVLGRYIAGDSVTLSIIRHGATMQVKVRLDAGSDQVPGAVPLRQNRPPHPQRP